MKNKISDLRNHMFAALERLGADDLTEEELKKEITRAQAISEVGKVIVESAKTEVMYAKLTGKRESEPTKFLETDKDQPNDETDQVKLSRPKAVYSNKSPMGISTNE